MPTTRRTFLGAATAAGFASSLAVGQSNGRTLSANDKIQIALIGCGGMGQTDAKSSTATGQTKLVAASDCYDGRLERMKEVYGQDIFTTRNYQEILARPDIDAILIGAPDHWHQRIAVDALKAKKHVYCEKPMVQKVEDGHAILEAEKASGKLLQVGSQRVSSIVYKKAQELYRSGAIGKINLVEAWWDRNSATGAWEYAVPLDASTKTCDWPQFQGRAHKAEWDPNRFFRWRCYQDYGTGVAGDLFVHLFSGLHFIIGATGPTRIFSTGGLRFWTDGRDVPDVLFGMYDYPETANHPAFNLVLRVNFVSGAEESSGFRFTGSEGLMTVDRNVTLTTTAKAIEPGFSINTFDKAEQAEFMTRYRQQYPDTSASMTGIRASREETFDPPARYSDHLDHHRTFVSAIRSGQPVIENGLFGLRAAAPAVLSNVSYFQKRVVEWDPNTLTVKS